MSMQRQYAHAHTAPPTWILLTMPKSSAAHGRALSASDVTDPTQTHSQLLRSIKSREIPNIFSDDPIHHHSPRPPSCSSLAANHTTHYPSGSTFSRPSCRRWQRLAARPFASCLLLCCCGPTGLAFGLAVGGGS
ncbi:hypothetical protein BCR44DRAFT_1427802 [Catenaria anguillulae PL171]|uniref:Uncharacterized protein n=1 Tax=Catenaria anguillulae PL171 TaxID=765915 RepID=A0A1Y2HYH2_9FUNG|nr:hypothetical protein BCR44DRAFT_1427802 [Catenaria anguillulae PL171]